METDKRLLVYALIDPRTERVRYIGKSMRGLHRPKAHTAASVVKQSANTHRGRWIAQLLAIDLAPVVRVLQACSTPEALSDAEIAWIAHGRREGWPLTNITDGGDGTSGWKMPTATREKIRTKLKGHPALVAANKGKKHSAETIAKRAASNTGKIRTPEQIERHAAAIRGKPMHPNTRAGLLVALVGHECSPETKEKMSIARKARDMSALTPAELAQRVACSRAGHTPEAKAKRSASMLRLWASPEYRASLKPRVPTEETRAKLSAMMLCRWSDPDDKLRMSRGLFKKAGT